MIPLGGADFAPNITLGIQAAPLSVNQICETAHSSRSARVLQFHPFSILPAGYFIHPRQVLQIPIDRLANAGFELTSPSFCTTTNERVYITARACELEFGGIGGRQAAGAGGRSNSR